MSYDFNADDVFEMAEQIERNGSKFYRSAAERDFLKPNEREMLLELARMEDQHEKMFQSMRSELSGDEMAPTVFDPNGEGALYLRALADIRVFFEKAIDTASMEAILKNAIEAEKDSIVFYLGMKASVPQSMGKDRLDEIIKEEMGHIRLLSQKLVAVKKD